MRLRVETFRLWDNSVINYRVCVNNTEIDFFDEGFITLETSVEKLLSTLINLDTTEQLYEYLITISDKGEYII